MRPCAVQAHFACLTSGQSVQGYGAAPLGAAPRQPSILFPINQPTETKWRTSYDYNQYERFLLLVHSGRAGGGRIRIIRQAELCQRKILASRRNEAAYQRRLTRNKAFYSLDCDDGIEYSACLHEPSPQELLDRKEMFFRLWNALNSLPEIQGRRVDAHLILGKSYRQIAREEGVDKSAVRCSVESGIKRMKKYLRENF